MHNKYKVLSKDYHWRWWNQGIHNAWRQWVTQIFTHLPESGGGKSILDYGCGDGKVMHELGKRGYAPTGFDTHEFLNNALEVAAERNPDATVTTEPVEQTFDYVLAIDSMVRLDVEPLVGAVKACKQYALIAAPVLHMPAATFSKHFKGCTIETLHTDDERQLWKVTPPKPKKRSQSKRKPPAEKVEDESAETTI